MRKSTMILVLILSIALLAAGCGNESSVDIDGDYFPLKVGNEWEYEYTSITGEPYRVKTVVNDTQKVDGRDTFVMLTSTKSDGTPIILEYFTKNDNGVAIVKSENITGAFLLSPDYFLLRYPIEEGQNWSWEGEYESLIGLDPLASTAEFNIQFVDSVEVPAGTFSDVMLVETNETLIVSDVTYEIRDLQWLAKDIGRIKRQSYVNSELMSISVLHDSSLLK